MLCGCRHDGQHVSTASAFDELSRLRAHNDALRDALAASSFSQATLTQPLIRYLIVLLMVAALLLLQLSKLAHSNPVPAT